MEVYLTIENAAKAMDCSTKTVKRMLDKGLLEYIEVGTGMRKSKRVKLPEPKRDIATNFYRKKKYEPKILKRR